MPEFDEPIDDYAAFFKDEHSRNVTEHFEDLVRSSGVDEAGGKPVELLQLSFLLLFVP